VNLSEKDQVFLETHQMAGMVTVAADGSAKVVKAGARAARSLES